MFNKSVVIVIVIVIVPNQACDPKKHFNLVLHVIEVLFKLVLVTTLATDCHLTHYSPSVLPGCALPGIELGGCPCCT